MPRYSPRTALAGMPGLKLTDSSVESEERFRALAEAAWEGIAFSRDGAIIDLNSQLAEIFGYERNELIGKKVLELVAPGSQATVLRVVRLGNSDAYEHQA